MRHRFHSLCPYFAMFPETFVARHLERSPHQGVVFDPFCGRGTTVFQALLQDRNAAGGDVNPVAVCIAGAKCKPPGRRAVEQRLAELHDGYTRVAPSVPDTVGRSGAGASPEFFERCFHRHTLPQVLYLRSVLNWRGCNIDRFIAALCLGALHGESHRSANTFSNRMPRTISTKPDYSIRWWQRHGYEPPLRDVFAILQRVTAYRFQTPPPPRTGEIVETDARDSGKRFTGLTGRVTDVITSPPYLDTTNYREDQWLRRWFLGDDPIVYCGRGDDRHGNKQLYWEFLQSSWQGLAPLLAEQVRMVIRIGSRHFSKAELQDGLLQSLEAGLHRSVDFLGRPTASTVKNTQANTFRGAKASQMEECDFVISL